MHIIIGLGNPGSRYAMTRHNIGWLVLDAVAARLGIEFEPGKGDYYRAEGSWRGRKLLLVKPTTYMNNSGEAARQVLRHYRATENDLLMVVDEIQVPLGRIKLSGSGSAGGHNGVTSMIEELGTADLARLRCGVGNNFGPGELVDYVLSPFGDEEIDDLKEGIAAGAEGVLLWVIEGTEKGMTTINRRAKKENRKPAVERDSSEESDRKNEGGTDISKQQV